MKRFRSEQGGFTLVELLVVVMVTGVIGAVIVSSFVASTRVTAVADDRISALSDLQRGLERVSRELRFADPLLLDSDGDYANALGASVVRNNERFNFRYYLVEVEDGEWELREDYERLQLDGTLIESRDGIFISDIANVDTGEPLFRYFRYDADGDLVEVDCQGLTGGECRSSYLTSVQVQLNIQKVIPRQDDMMAVSTVVNVRNTRIG